MTDTDYVDNVEELRLYQPEFSDWECELFGIKDGMVLNPIAGNVPNRFWRVMQYLILGNKWRKK